MSPCVSLRWAVLAAALLCAGPASAQRPHAPRPTAPILTPSDTYEAGGRRDPFVSLLKTGPDPGGRGNVPRPAGIGGLLVSEVAVKGVLQSGAGYAALLQGADTRTYVVHVGDRLLDGQVRAIAPDEVVLLQRSTDPLVVPKEVEVRKRLRQVGDSKR